MVRELNDIKGKADPKANRKTAKIQTFKAKDKNWSSFK